MSVNHYPHVLLYIWALLWSCFLSFSHSLSCSISSTELDALQSLYISTNGQQWQWKDGKTQWSFPAPLTAPCSQNWAGVSCKQSSTNNSVCSVDILSLPLYNLAGPIPSDISGLSKLTKLYLNNNEITGSVPYQFKSLNTLYLSYNMLIGSIPSQLFALTGLINLYLDYNYITSTIPSRISTLTNLEYLALNANHIMELFHPLYLH